MTISKEAIEAAHAEINKSWRNERWEWDAPKSAAERALRAALPFLPIAGEGKAKIKPLEWKELLTPPAGEEYAPSPIGTYYIELGRQRFPLKLRNELFGTFGTLDAAKAFAQADHETRILSALISSPGKDGGQEVEAVAFHVRIKGYGEELCFTEDGAQSLVKRLRRTKGQDGEATITPLYATTPKCSVCGGSGVEEVYGGHGTIMEVPCSICTAMPTTVERLTEVIRDTRALVAEAAATGFNWSDGDWAERLYANQAVLSFALSASTSREGESE